jgi:surface polysaccharide O-acyltransferase-like enzyme
MNLKGDTLVKKRENGLDYLRLIAAFLVVMTHANTLSRSTIKKLVAAGEVTKNFTYYYFMISRQLSEVAVPIFILLSGAFVLAAKSTKDYKSFYKKTWKKMVIPTIIFSVIYLFATCALYVHIGYFENFKEGMIFQLQQALLGKPSDHMWYMYMLIAVYIMCPFVVGMKDMLGEKNFKYAAWIVWVWGTIGNSFDNITIYWSLSFAINMLGIFMIGYVAHEWAKKKESIRSGVLMLLAGIGLSLLEVAAYFIGQTHPLIQKIFGNDQPFSPLIVLAGFFYVAAFTVFRFKKDCTYLSALTYWVYLVHPLIMYVVNLTEAKIFNITYNEVGATNMIAVSTVNTIIIYVLSFVVGHFIEQFSRRKKVKVSV